MRQRHEWFERFEGAYVALWWVPAGHIPSVDEAKKRLAHLDANGPTPFAFTFKVRFPPDEALLRATDWSRPSRVPPHRAADPDGACPPEARNLI